MNEILATITRYVQLQKQQLRHSLTEEPGEQNQEVWLGTLYIQFEKHRKRQYISVLYNLVQAYFKYWTFQDAAAW